MGTHQTETYQVVDAVLCRSFVPRSIRFIIKLTWIRCLFNTQNTYTYNASQKSPWSFLTFSPNGWKFLVHILQAYFRWDHAPLGQYYEQTRVLLEPIFAKLDAFDHSVIGSEMSASHDKLEIIYNSVVTALTTSANLCIPKTRRNFYKFWWSQELSELKAAAVTSSRAWQQAGKPKHGPIFQKYYSDKLAYKNASVKTSSKKPWVSPRTSTMLYYARTRRNSGSAGTLRLV